MGGTDCGFAQSAFLHRVHPSDPVGEARGARRGGAPRLEAPVRTLSAAAPEVDLRLRETQAKIVVHAPAPLPLRVAVLIDTAVVPADERLDF